MASLFIVDIVRAPIESLVIVYLMYRQIGVATLFGVAFLLLFIPFQGMYYILTDLLFTESKQIRNLNAAEFEYALRDSCFWTKWDLNRPLSHVVAWLTLKVCVAALQWPNIL